MSYEIGNEKFTSLADCENCIRELFKNTEIKSVVVKRDGREHSTYMKTKDGFCKKM